MLSGMARRGAKSGPAAGQDELGSSSSNTATREEKETEEAGGGDNTETRAAAVAKVPAAGRQSSGGPRKSADGERDASETGEDKAVTTSDYRPGSEEEEGDEEMDTEAVPQLDGADKEGKRDKKETTAGLKRGRGASSGAPPTKAMQLSTGERVATTSGGEKEEDEEGEEGEEGEGGEEESEGNKKEKSMGKTKHEQPTRKFSTYRPRTRSLSNSDSPLAPGVTTATKTSPMTRSHSAVKKDVEFVSLPSTKKRKKGGGRWPKRETPSPSPSQESSKPEAPVKQTGSKSDVLNKAADTKPEAPVKQTGSKSDVLNKAADTKKTTAAVAVAQESATEEGEGEEEVEETPPQPTAPPKRRRGRPPKKKDATTPTSSSSGKGKGGSTGSSGGGGKGKGKGKSDSAETEKKGEGKSKGEGSSKDKHSSDAGSSGKSSKSATAKEDKEEGENVDTETPLPAPSKSKSEGNAAPSTTSSERKKKKKERRGSGEDGKLSEGKGGRRKASAASLEEEVSETKSEKSPTENSSVVEEEARGGGGGKKGGGTRGSVFVSVLSGGIPPGGNEGDSKAKEKEEEVEVVSHDPSQQSRDLGNAPDESVQKPLIVQSTCSPTLPYPATTIPPFPPHAAYPYPGPYPGPPLMFPGPSNPMYPHYYPGYPHLPPVSSQPMPGSFISCQTEPLTSPFPVSTTAVCGVHVSVLDKPPTHLPTALSPHSPHSPHPISSQPSTHTVAMELARHYPPPHPLTQTYRPGILSGPPTAGPYMPPPSPYISVRIDPTGMPFVDWGMPHSHLPPHHHKMDDMNKNLGKLEPKQEEVPIQSVECPECGRSFKNNKALNGHMRLHGGFDWTKKPFSANHQNQSHSSSSTSGDAHSDIAPGNKPHPPNETSKKSSGKKRSNSPSPSPSGNAKKRRPSRDSNGSDGDKKSGEPSIFTFDTSQLHPSQHAMPPPPVLGGATQDTGTMTGAVGGAQEGGAAVSRGGSKGATLDDLCRAVEALEKMENGGGGRGGGGGGGRRDEDEDKRRPGNIQIPTHTSPSLERHRLGSSPPYTPPPILSPARSMALLATIPGTPSRIMQPWSARRSSDHRKPSEAEEGVGYLEPKINVGRQFQAVLPPCCCDAGSGAGEGPPPQASQDTHKAQQVWKPLSQPLEEDESVIDGFLELACSPAVLHAGRNKEYALHVLHNTGGSIKEAVRLLLMGRSLFPPDHPMATYHYSGSRHWSARERQQFRRAWRVHRKQFHLLKSAVEGKTLPEVTEYYYYWKKYCSDEYRGRNRHVSEEILSDDDLRGPRSHSSDAYSSSSSETEPLAPSHPLPETTDKYQRKPRSEGGAMPRPPVPPHFDLPIVYAPHSSRPSHGTPVQQYKCKYPGCTQVFTSIFALNGHIRIHGGSFYPKADKKEVRSSSPSMPPSSSSSSSSFSAPPSVLPSSHPPHHHSSLPPTSRAGSNGPVKHGRPPSSISAEMRSAQHLEIARALLDLPQPRSPARGGAYHTPSPKPSPGSKRSPLGKKKMSSSSPGEHEGYYPCNRCGRVFTKVKSRSAHMKSHIMKPS